MVVHKATNIAPIAILKAESVYQDENDDLHFFIPKIRDDCVLRLDGCDSHDENNDKLKFAFTEIDSKVKVVNDVENPCIGIVNGIQFGEYNFKVSFLINFVHKPLSRGCFFRLLPILAHVLRFSSAYAYT